MNIYKYRVKTDHLGLNVAIDFILNTPIVTPTKDAIGELIMFSTNHLVIPFGDVREQFKIMFSKSMNQKKIDLVKLGKIATDKELVSYLSLNLQLKTVSVYLLKSFQGTLLFSFSFFQTLSSFFSFLFFPFILKYWQLIRCANECNCIICGTYESKL